MLIIMCGFPGSGKSTYLSENFSATSSEVILCPDDFRLVITGRQYHGPAEDIVWSHVKTTARVLLKRGYGVVIDATHLTITSRKQWIRLADEIDVGVGCLWQKVTPDVARQRNGVRSDGHVVPERVMNRMIRFFVEPTVQEGFGSVSVLGT